MLVEVATPDDDLLAELRWHVIRGPGDGRLLACAKSFIRVVAHGGGVRMRVLGLANVACVIGLARRVAVNRARGACIFVHMANCGVR
jgi:hypothetical protein